MMAEHIARFDFRNLFVLDLANNHQGNREHGGDVIDACAAVAHNRNVRAAIKFQFRDLPEFVHRDHREKSPNKHAARFLSTRLDWGAFQYLHSIARMHGLVTVCTPFDEPSVDKIVEMGFDIVKIASCSARDWPLLEKIANTGLPVIASTGGLTQAEVDDLVSFLTHRCCDFALMHCVSIYPTPDEACNLANIAEFKRRYPGVTIGWSTHEPPADTAQVMIASAMGAEMFERHVGIETEEHKLNAYSSTPAQLDAWLAAWERAQMLIGEPKRGDPWHAEREAIDSLKRGVYARTPIEAGEVIRRDQVYFAFPANKGQIDSGDWTDGITSEVALLPDAPLMLGVTHGPIEADVHVLKSAIHEAKALLAYAGVTLGHEFVTEYSHHFGIGMFRQVGAVLITVINRAYAKKIIVQLPGQLHPWHHHRLKEETFHVLWGDLTIELDGRRKVLHPGDTQTIMPGVWHRFWTDGGVVFEELSTTAHNGDSVYRDPAINALTSAERKTVVDHWGRFQLAAPRPAAAA
jgi:N-acetylneuraminate synthase